MAVQVDHNCNCKKMRKESFKEVQVAYAVLSDVKKRKLYDQFGEQWQQAKQAEDRVVADTDTDIVGFDPSARHAQEQRGSGF